MSLSLKKFAATEQNHKWDKMIKREKDLYKREGDIRSEFVRDYTRIIHSSSFRRLKNKTQVFFSPQNDHICTRIEHVLHVESISKTIAHSLGLNAELSSAIALAHDLGHSPFGHKGERALNKIAKRELDESFWHEKQGLFVVDKLDLLEDDERNKKNLNLTYAVRDGIISHCGEIDEKALFPREEFIDLNDYTKPNAYSPFTYEACVVKVADKIAYIGRDIEDAISLGILDKSQLSKLSDILSPYMVEKLNNTIIINHLINDLCKNSSPENGIRFSAETFELLCLLKEFNFFNIYRSKKVSVADNYFELVINTIFDILIECFDGDKTYKNIKDIEKYFKHLSISFSEWISSYWTGPRSSNLKNPPIFNISQRDEYVKAILSYIGGMTDKYAMDTYSEIISF